MACTPETLEANRATARQRLAILARAGEDPTLCPPEIDLCLDLSRVCDNHGNVPASIDWCGAWNLNRAAYEAWLLKAGKVSPAHDITIDGRTFAASQVKNHCDEMAKVYRNRLAGTIVLGACPDEADLPAACLIP
jgi:hypothetical protein